MRANHVYSRVREEMVMHQAHLEDPHLTTVTIVVKIDQRTGLVGNILWRPEFQTGRGGGTLDER